MPCRCSDETKEENRIDDEVIEMMIKMTRVEKRDDQTRI